MQRETMTLLVNELSNKIILLLLLRWLVSRDLEDFYRRPVRMNFHHQVRSCYRHRVHSFCLRLARTDYFQLVNMWHPVEVSHKLSSRADTLQQRQLSLSVKEMQEK